MSLTWRGSLLGFTLVAGAFLTAGCSREPDPRSVDALKQATAGKQPPASVAKAVLRGEWPRIRGFYAARSHRPAWTSGRKLAREFGQAVTLLENAEADALDPKQYDLAWLRARREYLEGWIVGRAIDQDDELVELELRTTAAVLRWAHDLSLGRFDPDRRGEWARPKTDLDPGELVRTAIDDGGLANLPEQLRPTNRQYGALLELWREHAALVAAGGWG
jgi:murein L,D-transpeptidase YcbB/YkuD